MKTIFHLDMDAFFVSVEELYNPELKGKPVVVGGQPNQRGVVSAASYAARKFGVHSAMPLRTAYKLCPQAIFVEGHPKRYKESSEQVFRVLRSFSPQVEMASIDEAYLDLTGSERLHGPPLLAAHKLHEKIRERTNLNCSIGVATSRLVAKICSDQAKPNGVLYILPGTEARFLAPLDVRKIPGVGKVTEKALHDCGIRKIGDLAFMDVSGRVALDIDPRAILKVGAVLFGLWILVRAWSVVVLLGIALMLVATLSPLIRRLEARVHRRYGIILLCVALVAGLAGLLGILLPPLLRQGQSLAQHFPEYTQAIEGALRRWRVPVSLASLTQGYRAQAAPQLLSAATVLFGGIVELVMIALLTIYLLIDGPRVQLGLIRLFPRTERLSVRQVLDTLTEQVGSYVRGQLLTSGAAGIFSFLLLIACHVPEPLALAVWMMVADAIPLVGLVLGTVPAVLLALTQSPTTAVIVGVGYLVYHQIEIAVLVPWVYGSRMKLSGSAILVSILVGGKLMGIVGALVALPLAAAAPVVIRHLGQWRDRQTDRQADRRRGGGDGGASAG